MYYKKLFLIILLFIIKSTFAQEFVRIDLRIGDTSVNHVNPEISPFDNYMIWIEVDTANGLAGKVWQCGIDPNTGDLIPPDG